MALLSIILVLSLSHLITHISAQTSIVICSDGISTLSQNCSSGYTCPTDGNCAIYCVGTNCAGATLGCPLNGDCYIECREGNGCEGTTINATYQNGNFTLLCEDDSDASDTVNNRDICQSIKVLGSTLSSNTGSSFHVTCGFDRNTCRNGIINCAKGMDCEVDCHSKDTAHGIDGSRASCRNLTINGPDDHNLTVQCGDNNACQASTVYGRNASFLHVTCTDNNGCCDMEMYCPTNDAITNTNVTKRCYISGM